MNKKISMLLIIGLLSMGLVSAVEPDSSLWGAELFFEKLWERLSNKAFDNHMQERIQEINTMQTKNKLAHALRAKAEYDSRVINLVKQDDVDYYTELVEPEENALSTAATAEGVIVVGNNERAMSILGSAATDVIKKQGAGRVRISGNGYVYMKGSTMYFVDEISNDKGKVDISGIGRMTLTDYAGDATVEIVEKGFGKVVDKNEGTSRPQTTIYSGKGRAIVRGSSMVIKVFGKNLYVDASGKGLINARGNFEIIKDDEPSVSVSDYYSTVLTPLVERTNE